MWNSGIVHLKKPKPAIKCPEEFIKVGAFTENAFSCPFDSHRGAINFNLHAIHHRLCRERNFQCVHDTLFLLLLILLLSFFSLSSLFLVTRLLYTRSFLSSPPLLPAPPAAPLIFFPLPFSFPTFFLSLLPLEISNF